MLIHEKKRSKATKDIKRETIVIKTNEGTYADTLRKIKKTIDTEKVGVQVKSVQRIKEGYVKLKINSSGKGSGEELKKEMLNKLENSVEVEDIKKKKHNDP